MVRSFLLCVAASLILSTTVIAEDTPKEKINLGSVEYLDSLDGFRGVKFGTTFSEFKDLSVDRDLGKLKLYTKKGEDLSLGLAKLGAIVYHFFDDKFYGVSIFPGSMNRFVPSESSAWAGRETFPRILRNCWG